MLKVLCDDETNLESIVSLASEKVLASVERHRIAIKDPDKTDVTVDLKQHDPWFLLSLDSTTLNSLTDSKPLPSNSRSLREVFLNCNLLEFSRTREKLLHVLWEKKAVSRVYKGQYAFLGIPQNKRADMYFSSLVAEPKNSLSSNNNSKPPAG